MNFHLRNFSNFIHYGNKHFIEALRENRALWIRGRVQIVLALAVAFYKIPYPISIDANGEVINQRTVQVFVPYKYLYLFDEPRTAHVSFEGNDNASYNCDITSHKARLIHREDGNYFMAIATVSTQGQKSPVLQKYMKADVRIIVSNKTLWQQVFG